jgi:hypothetical protein
MRWDCDPHLLGELIELLVASHEDIASTGLDPASSSTLERAIQICRDEATAIAGCHQEGTAGERLDMLARLANQQFRVVQVHLAGRQRTVLRPGLLGRIVHALTHTHTEMQNLAATPGLARAVAANAGTVQAVITDVAREHAACKAARDALGSDRLRFQLIDLADELGSTDSLVGPAVPTGVGDVCDAMFNLLVQLRDVFGEHPQEERAFERAVDAHDRLCRKHAETSVRAAKPMPGSHGTGLE